MGKKKSKDGKAKRAKGQGNSRGEQFVTDNMSKGMVAEDDSELEYPNADQITTAHGDDIEKAWWMTCWLDRSLRLYRAPIASRLTAIAGSHESKSNVLVLSSAYELPLRVGESLDYLAMKAFASASMLSPSGRNNILPHAVGNELMEIHTDSSAKTGIIGISAVFSVRDYSYSYAGGMIIDKNLLIFHYGEFIAAVSALLVAVSHGYRDIVISTDNESLVRVWNDEEIESASENVGRQVVALKGILVSQGYSVRIRHVKGHALGFRNTMADGLAEMGYSRPTRTEEDGTLEGFDYAELREAYNETICLNERLLATVNALSSLEGVPSVEEVPSVKDIPKTDLSDETSDEAPDELPEVTETTGDMAENQTPEEVSPSIDSPATSRAVTLPVPMPVTDARDAYDRLSREFQPPEASPSVQPMSWEVSEETTNVAANPVPQPRPHSLSINQPTVAICRVLNDVHDNVNINRVDRLVASGAIEKWEGLNKSRDNLQYARSLLSDDSIRTDNRRIDAIWDALAKNVAKKIANRYSSQKKRSFLVVRTMLVARLCGVPIEPAVDYVLSHNPTA